MRKALWLGGGIAGMGNIPILGVKKKVEPVEPEPTDPTDPSTPSTVESMLVTPAAMDVIISSTSDLEIDWGDGTIQTVKSGDDLSFFGYGVTCNKYSHTYTDSFEDKVISIKHLDGESPIQFLSSMYLKTVQRWYSEGYQPIHFFNDVAGFDQEMAFYSLGMILDTVPNTAPPKTTHLSGLFAYTNMFNQDISGWDVSNVTNLAFTFAEAKAFNHPLATWDVGNVTNMYGMFSDATTFNHDISGWDVGNVTNMGGMFYNAKAFNQDLSQWCVSNITSEPVSFSAGSALTAEHKPVWGTCPSDEDTIPDPVPDPEPTDPIVDTIINMFANNEQGFYYDPNDLETLYQDAEGTVPVTDIDQPVGLILDKSGNNNHAFQTNSASRPILRKNTTTGANYLAFDGVDDWLQTNTINFSVSDKISLFTGLTKLSDKVQILAELSKNASLSGSFGSFLITSGPDGIPNGYSTVSRGFEGVSGKRAYCSTFPFPDNAVLTVKHDISGDLSSMRRNGVVGVNDTSDKGTGNFRSYPMFIGRRGGTSFAFTGHIYGMIVVSRLPLAEEEVSIEKEFAKQVGVVL